MEGPLTCRLQYRDLVQSVPGVPAANGGDICIGEGELVVKSETIINTIVIVIVI